MSPTDDSIEHDIHIASHAEEVWQLISRPGWWINEDVIDDNPVLRTEDDVTVLTHAAWGDFTLLTVSAERPRQISYRWASMPSAELSDDASTLVEFSIVDEPGGVRLRVVESGFATLDEDPEVGRAQRDNNLEGWHNELRAARDHVTAHRG